MSFNASRNSTNGPHSGDGGAAKKKEVLDARSSIVSSSGCATDRADRSKK